MTDKRIIVRGQALRREVEHERDRLHKEEGLDLSLAQTAARLLRLGLGVEKNREQRL